MPAYLCRVANDSGKIEELRREAATEDSCLRECASQGLFVISVRAAEGGGAAGRGGERISRKSLSEVTDILALMLASGLSLKDSLEIAQGIFDRGESNALIARLLGRLRKGSSFADALEASGVGIPPFYSGMVRIGERIGTLDQVLARLSSFLKEEKALRERFSSALIYPCIVLGVAAACAVFIVAFLFPRLEEIFSDLGPAMGGNVRNIMGGMRVALLIAGFIALALGAAIAALTLARRKEGRKALRVDSLVLSVPLVSRFLVRREILNFAFAMEALTSAGVSVEEALSEGSGALTNRALKRAALDVRDRLLKGEKLSAAFAASPAFPERIARWMGVGERIGHVEKVFGQLRAYYQQEVEKWISRIMALIEPVLIVGLGIVIILFVVFFIVPIFSLYGNVM